MTSPTTANPAATGAAAAGPAGDPGRVGLVAVTAAGRAAADELASAWPGARVYPGAAADALPAALADCDTVVCFLAVGAAVRLLAPLLGDKRTDPGVVCVDEARRFAVPVVGGHHGANALAERVAAHFGATAVITTASEASGTTALDSFGADAGLLVEPGSALAAVGAAVLSGAPVRLARDRPRPLPALPPNVRAEPAGRPVAAIVISDRAVPAVPAGEAVPTVTYRPASLVVGVGASRGAPAREIAELVDAALADAGLSPLSVRHLATAAVKADEPGIVALAAARGWALVTYPADLLATVAVPHPSAVVDAAVGTPSVAEAASRLDPERRTPTGEIVAAKRASAHATAAISRHPPRGRLAVVGLGPGARDLLTPRAARELARAGVIVGLDQYIDSVRDLIRPGADIRASGLGAEEERARAAVEAARAGHAVALLGSGDAGIYAMASPALAFAGDVVDGASVPIDVVGVPGVSAAQAAAALLGAPLGHDHALISLSDLHTPWPVIERRVRAAAEADLVVAFYNPRSRRRTRQLRDALDLLAAHRPATTPVGIVTNAFRDGQTTEVITLDAMRTDAALARVGMTTTVIVGASTTQTVAGRMVTPRGYRWA
jgi:cobalt-precorrin 5A hydrolase / precorrin-3B C17-methyltransferase